MEQKTLDLLHKVIDIKKELELRKALYEELDTVLLALAGEGFTSAELDGLVLSLQDNFAEGNTSWTAAAVKRYDLKIEPRDKYEKRMAKRVR